MRCALLCVVGVLTPGCTGSMCLVIPHTGWRRARSDTRPGRTHRPRGAHSPPAARRRGADSYREAWENGWMQRKCSMCVRVGEGERGRETVCGGEGGRVEALRCDRDLINGDEGYPTEGRRAASHAATRTTAIAPSQCWLTAAGATARATGAGTSAEPAPVARANLDIDAQAPVCCESTRVAKSGSLWVLTVEHFGRAWDDPRIARPSEAAAISVEDGEPASVQLLCGGRRRSIYA